jgi:hypothetical protein
LKLHSPHKLINNNPTARRQAMNERNTITAILYERDTATNQQQLVPGVLKLQARMIEIKKEVIAQSLSTLIGDLHDIVNQLPATNGISELETLSVSVQLSANGGAVMIVSANAEITNAITLTFKIKKHE